MAQQGAGGESKIDYGNLVVANGAHFPQLRLAQSGEGFQYLSHGPQTFAELFQLGVVVNSGEQNILSRGENTLPILSHLIQGVIDSLRTVNSRSCEVVRRCKRSCTALSSWARRSSLVSGISMRTPTDQSE